MWEYIDSPEVYIQYCKCFLRISSLPSLPSIYADITLPTYIPTRCYLGMILDTYILRILVHSMYAVGKVARLRYQHQRKLAPNKDKSMIVRPERELVLR